MSAEDPNTRNILTFNSENTFDEFEALYIKEGICIWFVTDKYNIKKGEFQVLFYQLVFLTELSFIMKDSTAAELHAKTNPNIFLYYGFKLIAAMNVHGIHICCVIIEVLIEGRKTICIVKKQIWKNSV